MRPRVPARRDPQECRSECVLDESPHERMPLGVRVSMSACMSLCVYENSLENKSSPGFQLSALTLKSTYGFTRKIRDINGFMCGICDRRRML